MGRVERDQLKYSKIRTKDKFVDQFNYWLINLLPWRYCLELWSVELWYHWIVILVTFQNKYICLTIITHVAFHNKYVWTFQIITMSTKMSQDAKKDEFRKYLEKAGRWFKSTCGQYSSLKCSQDSKHFFICIQTTMISGVLELLTKSLVSLYEVW